MKTIAQVKLSYSHKAKPPALPKVEKSHEVYDPETVEFVETFHVLLLNRRNAVLGCHKVSEGGTIGTYVDVRHVMQAAILSNATSIILTHNHPTGNLQESVEDRRLTNQVKEACRILNIKLLDHIVYTTEGYKSFADDGLI